MPVTHATTSRFIVVLLVVFLFIPLTSSAGLSGPGDNAGAGPSAGDKSAEGGVGQGSGNMGAEVSHSSEVSSSGAGGSGGTSRGGSEGRGGGDTASGKSGGGGKDDFFFSRVSKAVKKASKKAVEKTKDVVTDTYKNVTSSISYWLDDIGLGAEKVVYTDLSNSTSEDNLALVPIAGDRYTFQDIVLVNVDTSPGRSVQCPSGESPFAWRVMYEARKPDESRVRKTNINQDACADSRAREDIAKKLSDVLYLEHNFERISDDRLLNIISFNGHEPRDTRSDRESREPDSVTTSHLFDAVPDSGEAPLTVTFASLLGDVSDYRPSAADGQDTVLDFGDSSDPVWLHCEEAASSTEQSRAGSINLVRFAQSNMAAVLLAQANGSAETSDQCASPILTEHMYSREGTYYARVLKTGGFCAGTCPETELAKVKIVVGENSANTISFEVMAESEHGTTTHNWTADDVVIAETDQIFFRWNASDYDKCLPFLADNRSYILKQNSTSTTGNTETEDYDINEQTGEYRLECSRVVNGDLMVDSQSIYVTVGDDPDPRLTYCYVGNKKYSEGDTVQEIQNAYGYSVHIADASYVCRSGVWKIEGGYPAVACTEEAKQCSDGSFVGRTGPNCEFAACPSEKSKGGSSNFWDTTRGGGEGGG
ncbi:MAG: hypothetical protein R3B69_03745 [Candidatus Paceibacterota bacterium]